MQPVVTCLLALAGSTAALLQPRLSMPMPTPAPQIRAAPALEARQRATAGSLSECASSMRAVVTKMPLPAAKLTEWAMSANIGNSCSQEVAESLSSDVLVYETSLYSWIVDAMSTLKAVEAKCTELPPNAVDTDALLPGLCSTTASYYWVNADGKTRAEAMTTPAAFLSAIGATNAQSSGATATQSSGAAKSNTLPPSGAASGLRSAGLGMLAVVAAAGAALL